MRYTQQVLRPGEQIIAVGKFHWLYSAGAYLSLLVLGIIIIIIIGIVTFLGMMIRKWTTEIVVTTDRLMYKTGWIARHVEEISLTRIEEISLTQTVMGRVLGYGSLRVSGTGTSVIHLPSILSDPVEFRRALAEGRTAYPCGPRQLHPLVGRRRQSAYSDCDGRGPQLQAPTHRPKTRLSSQQTSTRRAHCV